jgi:hypothetical protein
MKQSQQHHQIYLLSDQTICIFKSLNINLIVLELWKLHEYKNAIRFWREKINKPCTVDDQYSLMRMLNSKKNITVYCLYKDIKVQS